MDEQRVQAYVGLIGELLACPQGKEREVLQAKAELVDAGLLKMMAQVANLMQPNGFWLDRYAVWLRQCSDILGIVRPLCLQDEAYFFLETLQLIAESNGNSQQVYMVWEKQTDLLNENLLTVIPKIVSNLFQQQREKCSGIASDLVNFGNLIQRFPDGKSWLNQELSIAAYQLALQGYDEFSEQWADIQINLALAYINRSQGSLPEHLEQAILGCQYALKVYYQYSERWARAHHHLALAYISYADYVDYKISDRGKYIKQAIKSCHLALHVYTYKSFPTDWARVQNSLATAYLKCRDGDPSGNIEKAIIACKKALTVRNKEVSHSETYFEWVGTMNNLAVAYQQRILGEDPIENIQQAISIYDQLLMVSTRKRPVDWATIKVNLATAYNRLARLWKDKNLEPKIAQEYFKKSTFAYKEALIIFTPESYPQRCRESSRALGSLYLSFNHWSEAAEAYKIALQAAELLYQSANLFDSKSAELSETQTLFRNAAYAYARTGNLTQAIETLEQGRARGLSESLDRDRANLQALQTQNQPLYNQYKEITQQLRNLEAEQRNLATSADRHNLTPESLRDTAIALRQQLNHAIEQIRTVPGYETFLTQPTLTEIRQATTLDRPLVYLSTTSAGSLALILTPDDIIPIWLDEFTEPQLREMLYGPADDPELSRWFGAYQNFRNDSKANYLQWCEEIDTTTRQLWDPLMGPIVQQLQTLGHSLATLIPAGLLSLLPLHAAWTPDPNQPTGRRYALDTLHLTYAPNAKSLTAAQAIAARTPATSILAIDNPTRDPKLSNSEREIKAAISKFPNYQVLRHTEATVEALLSKLPEAAIVHFSCHGTANLTDPLTSGLLMSDGLLTLKDIFALNLSEGNQGIRLAILSACETGMTGIENADEAISLPTGLLQAGVAAVVASLWSVDELSTMMLLSRFYDFWRKDGLTPDQALRKAQQWMHSTTDGEKATYCGLRWPTARKNDRTYAHPFHWAAFSYLGV